MTAQRRVFLGTDSGATTSKTGGVWDDGSILSTDLQQHATDSQAGPQAVVDGWVAGASQFLARHGLGWDQVAGVGLATPGPFKSPGVLSRSANLPASFDGFEVQKTYAAALARAAGRAIPLMVGNDGDMGGVGEAREVRGDRRETVVMLAPGSGLGCAYVDADGLPLSGDALAGMEAAHMPAPLHLFGGKPYPCGCGRDWGCVEVYTTISGLPHLLAERLPRYPGHELAHGSEPDKKKVLHLRGLAQEGDALALEIFEFQATVLGLHVASLAMALDPRHVVIGGGLMDPGATTAAFRESYLGRVRETARKYLWPAQKDTLQVVAARLGDLSQSIGAALVARATARLAR